MWTIYTNKMEFKKHIKEKFKKFVRFKSSVSPIYKRGEKVTNEEFEKIYQVYFRDVYYYILSLSKDKFIAEDITSETFLKAMKSTDDFRRDASIKSWVCQIGKNEYFSSLRKDKKIVFTENIEEIKGLEISDSIERLTSSKYT